MDCFNVDGIILMYLVRFFGIEVESGIYNFWEYVISVIKSYGGKMWYLNKDVEYNLIYKCIYGYIFENVMLDIRLDICYFVLFFLLLYEKRNNDLFYCGLCGFFKSFEEDFLLRVLIWYEIVVS